MSLVYELRGEASATARNDIRLNHLVFKMLDDNRDGLLNIVDLLRLYVNLPRSSIFA